MVTATFALICSDMSVQGSPGGEVKGSEKRIGNGRLIRLRRNKGWSCQICLWGDCW